MITSEISRELIRANLDKRFTPFSLIKNKNSNHKRLNFLLKILNMDLIKRNFFITEFRIKEDGCDGRKVLQFVLLSWERKFGWFHYEIFNPFKREGIDYVPTEGIYGWSCLIFWNYIDNSFDTALNSQNKDFRNIMRNYIIKFANEKLRKYI